MVTNIDAARELLARRRGRLNLHDYITYVQPEYKVSEFSRRVCAAIDDFIVKVNAGKRPILILSAPPQHGKSEIVSRRLPAFLMSRFPKWKIAAASYSNSLAGDMSTDVRRNMTDPRHLKLFPVSTLKRKYTVNRSGQFSNPYGSGSYISDGVGGGFTGKASDIFIIDDPIKNAQEALSAVTKESIWNWFLSTSKTRMSEKSGQIIMMTRWAEDDLAARVIENTADKSRLIDLRFPAINSPDEAGYKPDMPPGPLAPELHSIEHLLEFKSEMSAYWFAALYQQEPRPIGGNIFKEEFAQTWFPKTLPEKWDRQIISWDCTFKDTDGTDFVVGTVWGKKGSQSYLLDMVRDRMSFSRTTAEVIALHKKWPAAAAILIEDKANGPAVIDTLKGLVPGIIAIEPDGSKEARAHAVSTYWEARNIFLPHKHLAPWIEAYLSEMTVFPAGAHDDQVDSTTQALRYLYPLRGRLSISKDALERAMGVA